MLWTALALLALSAAVGGLILIRRWQGEEVSLVLTTLGHGAPAVAALVLAWIPVSDAAFSGLADLGLLLLAATALAGVALLVWQLWKERFSLILAVIHGLAGAAGLLLLLLWTLTRSQM